MKLTVVIPTYNRPGIVVDTVRRLQALDPPPDGIIVVDQTPTTNEELRTTNAQVIRLDAPSIPHAMNVGRDCGAAEEWSWPPVVDGPSKRG